MKSASRQEQMPNIGPSMKGPLVTSALFHLILFALTTIGLPFVAKDRLIVTTPISVEIVEVEAETKVKVSPKPKPEEIKKPEPQPEPQKKPEPPKMVEEEPPAPEPLPEPVKKVEEKSPPPKPKKPPAKPKPQNQEDKFTSLLKNLAPDAEELPEQKTEPAPQVEDSQIARLADRLTMSELDAVKRGLMPCWNVMAGGKYAEEQIVEVRVLMNPDRTVQHASILNQGRYNRDSHFRAAADAALRALRNPRCSPLQLPPEKYMKWKAMIIEFNPSEML